MKIYVPLFEISALRQHAVEMQGAQAYARATGRGTIIKVPRQLFKSGYNPAMLARYVDAFNKKTFLMRFHPDLFPKIYRYSPGNNKIPFGQDNYPWREEEELDIDRAKQELIALGQATSAEDDLDPGLYMGVWDYRDDPRERQMLAKIEQAGLKETMERYVELCNKIFDVTRDTWLDAHMGNFGYSKDGTLKMLDY